MKYIRSLFLLLMVLLFFFGMAVLLTPVLNGIIVERQMQRAAEDFLSRVEVQPLARQPESPEEIVETIPEPTEPDTYTQLWRDMRSYNSQLYENGQKELSSKLAYETPSFCLKDYGLADEIFAVLSIPKMELEMPVYLGATYQHMADGAALLSQTSIPIGGNHTNSVIAGHRGWGGADYFRYLDTLQPGDEIYLTNLWEELTYEVSQIQIIQPNEVEKILIQPERDLLTLLTCHPYASGGRQRYLVICQRTGSSPISNDMNTEVSNEKEHS